MTKLHPAYKEAAKQIADNGKVFYSDGALSMMLEEPLDTKFFDFARLKLIAYLLDEYGIDFIRSEIIAADDAKLKGYKIATPAESVKITARRLDKRVNNAARKQRKVLSVVDYGALPAEVQKEYDARVIRGGLLAAFLAQTPLKRCVPGVVVRFDRPSIIDKRPNQK